MAQHILGIDLGARAVKAVLLESTFRGFVVLDAARAPVPAPEAEDASPLVARQAAALHALLAERGWRVDEAMVAFPGAAASSHVITLPFTDPRRIEQTIGFEVEGQIPFELSQVAWDWQPLGTRDGKTDLLVGVVRKEELSALLAALAHGGVDPRAVLPAGPAYAALHSAGVLAGGPTAPAAPEPEAPAPVPGAEVLADVGAERTSVCVTVGGVCEAARTFAAGPGGTGPLVRELRATLRAGRARVGPRPVTRLLLAGEGATLPGVAEALAPEVEGPIEPVVLAGPTASRIPAEDAPGLALALALALRGHQGARAPRLNLRRGELAYTRDFEHLKGKVARLGVYAAAIALLAVASAGVKVLALARQESALDRALCDAQQKILGRCYPNFEEAQAILRGRGAPGAALPRTSAVELLGELAERVPPQLKLRLDRIEITRDKLHVEGTTDGAEGVDRLVQALKASRCFGDARSGSARKRATDGKFEFSIDSGLTCLESGPRDAAGGRG